MFQILRDDAVALCEGYGFLMAAGWKPQRLTKKTVEMQKMIRSGEYPDFEKLDEDVQKVGMALSKAEDFEIVQKMKARKQQEEKVKAAIEELEEEDDDEEKEDDEEDEDDVMEDEDDVDEDEDVEEEEDEEDEEDEDEDEEIVAECVLKIGERIFVNDEDPWKGTISAILNSKYVEVEDRKGETWEVAIEKCRVLQQKGKKLDPQEEELRRLEAQVRKAKQTKKTKGKTKAKKVTRLESVFQALEKTVDSFDSSEIAKSANQIYMVAGGSDNVSGADGCIKIVVQTLIRFGCCVMKGKKIVKI